DLLIQTASEYEHTLVSFPNEASDRTCQTSSPLSGFPPHHEGYNRVAIISGEHPEKCVAGCCSYATKRSASIPVGLNCRGHHALLLACAAFFTLCEGGIARAFSGGHSIEFLEDFIEFACPPSSPRIQKKEEPKK